MSGWVAGAVVVGAIGGSLISRDAARSASNKQADAAAAATAAQVSEADKARADQAPWREAGANALSTLMDKINAGPGVYEESPYYQTGLTEGEKAINRSGAAKGGLLSGRNMKDITRFGEDYALKDYQNWLGNYYQSLAPLQSVAGLGMTTANQSASNAIQTGAQIGQNTILAGNAQATGDINQANAITGGVNSGINNYLMWKYMNPSGGAASVDYSGGPSSAYNPQYTLGAPQYTEMPIN